MFTHTGRGEAVSSIDQPLTFSSKVTVKILSSLTSYQ